MSVAPDNSHHQHQSFRKCKIDFGLIGIQKMALLQGFISISHAVFGNWLIVLITSLVGYLLYRGVFGNNSTKISKQRKRSKEKSAGYEIMVGGNGEMKNKLKLKETIASSVDDDKHNVSVENEETTAKLSEKLQLPPHPHFPQLKITDESRGPEHATKLPPNARRPVPFKNDNFSGHILLLLKSNPADPYWEHHFSGKKRIIEVRIQGKF